MQAGTKKLGGAFAWNRERCGKFVGGLVHEVAGASRVAQNQQNAVHSAVTQLELEPAIECLSVPRQRLGLKTEAPTQPTDSRIPGTLVSRNWQGHFGCPAQGSVER